MPLAGGQALSFYEILGPLGVGGMGEVYLARDTRLERKVAIKVLPEALAIDVDRLRRFEREAKTLAALNHPNVAGIHGVDEVQDTRFLAMEFVPGEDLEQRLKRGALPLHEALDVCRQIADGLEAAHEAGVVHRDLKPANVRLTPEGAVKILDFGLAKPMGPKAQESDGSGAQSDSFLVTSEGMILGTPTYMSPAQARGRPVDRRTDIWAFGCVLFECLAGKRAFKGDAFGDLIAAILEHEVDLDALPAATPPQVRHLIMRCLVKDPRERLRDIGEARIALDPTLRAAISEHAPRAPTRPISGILLGTVLASLVWGAALLTRAASMSAEREPMKSALHLGIERADGRLPWLSPSGEFLAYTNSAGLWLRELARPEALCILRTRDEIRSVNWCPDAASLVFARNGVLETLRRGDARAEPRCALPEGRCHFACGDDGSILVEVVGQSTTRGVYLLAPGADTLERLDWIDPSGQLTPGFFFPSFLPGSKQFLLTDQTSEGAWIHVATPRTKSMKPVARAASRAAFVEPGWLAWCESDRILVQRFDTDALEVTGRPQVLVDDVSNFPSRGDAGFSFSNEGTLFYRRRPGETEVEWMGRDGRTLSPVLESGRYRDIALDPLGKRLALVTENEDTGSRDLWIRDLERRVSTRLITHERWLSSPTWSPDGTQLAFVADWKGPPHLYLVSASGGEPTELVPYDGTVHGMGCWTPDGQSVIYHRDAAGGTQQWIVDVNTLERRPLSESHDYDAALSPDGRWLATQSRESGRSQVYVATYPRLETRIRISAEGGVDPCWNATGSEHFYLSSEGIMVTAFDRSGPTGKGSELVASDSADDLMQFSVAQDGERLIVLRADRETREPADQLVTDWERLLE